MKKYLVFLFFTVLTSVLFGQNSAFLLVDVSGSMPGNLTIREDAKKIARDLCLGQFKASTYDDNWEWLGPIDPALQRIVNGRGAKPLIDPNQNGYFMIMPFGAKDTYKKYQIGRINKLPGDLDVFFNTHYPKRYTDKYTYQKIAYAAAASIAKGQQINDYYMIVVSDDLTDPNTGSKAPSYTKEEQKWLAAWGTSAAKNTKIGTLLYSGTNYQIVISRVNISNVSIAPTTPPPASVATKGLKLVRPIGTKKTPTTVSGTSISVLWNCLGCGAEDLFTVRLSKERKGSSKSSFKPQTKKTKNSSSKFTVEESGTYKVTVSTSGMAPAIGYVELKAGGGGGGGGILPLLLVLLMGGVGYFLWKRNQDQSKAMDQDRDRDRKKDDRKDRYSNKGNSRSSGGNSSGGESTGDFW